MSRRVQRITRILEEAGACWAVKAKKYCSPYDPLWAQENELKTWHIHPDADHPYQDNIYRFKTLDELEDWVVWCRGRGGVVQTWHIHPDADHPY